MEDFTESIETKSLPEGKLKDEFIYLAALSILRNLYDKGAADIGVLERINRKNAEKMNCTPIGII